MVKKGTCGACFRAMSLTGDSKLVRHGWREEGGTRRVGAYGNVSHSGPCFGVGWDPYEVSPKCTEAFVDRVLFPMGVRCQEELAWIATRPALVFNGRTFLGNEPQARGSDYGRGKDWDGYGEWQVRLRDGMPATCLQKVWEYDQKPGQFKVYNDDYKKIPSYEAHRAGIEVQIQSRWKAISTDGLYCLKMIAEWKPTAVPEVARKMPLVHTPNPARTHYPMCRWSRGMQQFNISADVSKVTCPKCLTYLASYAATQAAKAKT